MSNSLSELQRLKIEEKLYSHLMEYDGSHNEKLEVKCVESRDKIQQLRKLLFESNPVEINTENLKEDLVKLQESILNTKIVLNNELKRLREEEKLLDSNNIVSDDLSDLKIENVGKTKKVFKVSVLTDDEKKEMILNWKMQKLQLLMKREEDILNEESERLLKKEQYLKHVKEVKQKVENWKRSKSSTPSSISADCLSNNEKKPNLIKHFQEQDSAFIQNRRKILTTKSADNLKIHKKTIIAERDPQRVLQPTKQWLSKLADTRRKSVDGGTCINDVSQLKKRAIPEWRAVASQRH